MDPSSDSGSEPVHALVTNMMIPLAEDAEPLRHISEICMAMSEVGSHAPTMSSSLSFGSKDQAAEEKQREAPKETSWFHGFVSAGENLSRLADEARRELETYAANLRGVIVDVQTPAMLLEEADEGHLDASFSGSATGTPSIIRASGAAATAPISVAGTAATAPQTELAKQVVLEQALPDFSESVPNAAAAPETERAEQVVLEHNLPDSFESVANAATAPETERSEQVVLEQALPGSSDSGKHCMDLPPAKAHGHAMAVPAEAVALTSCTAVVGACKLQVLVPPTRVDSAASTCESSGVQSPDHRIPSSEPAEAILEVVESGGLLFLSPDADEANSVSRVYRPLHPIAGDYEPHSSVGKLPDGPDRAEGQPLPRSKLPEPELDEPPMCQFCELLACNANLCSPLSECPCARFGWLCVYPCPFVSL